MFRFSSRTLQPYRSALPFEYSFSMIEKECTHVLNTDMATQGILPLINPISMKKASPPIADQWGTFIFSLRDFHSFPSGFIRMCLWHPFSAPTGIPRKLYLLPIMCVVCSPENMPRTFLLPRCEKRREKWTGRNEKHLSV